MNKITVMDNLISLAREFDGVECEMESENAVCFYSVPQYEGNLKYSAAHDLHRRLKGMGGLIIDVSEAEESDDGRDLLYVQIEVEE